MIDTRPFKKGDWEWEGYWNEVKGFNAQGMILVGLQDGLPQGFKVTEMPIVYWALTDPICLEKNLQTALVADAICVAQKKYVSRYEEIGKNYVEWLALAFDSIGLGDPMVTEKYDIAFVGSNYKGSIPPRKRWLELLGEKRQIFTSGSKFLGEMAGIYSNAKIVYNYSVKDDLNMRIFEAMGCGSLLLTNRLSEESGLSKLFQEDKHYVAYTSFGELEEKVAYYLGRNSERRAIAKEGQSQVLLRHTFLNRADYFCELIVNGW
jgi:hypothetical protein